MSLSVHVNSWVIFASEIDRRTQHKAKKYWQADLCRDVLVVPSVKEHVTDVVSPDIVRVDWLNVQAAALYCLEWHATKHHWHWQNIITIDDLWVSVVHKEHIHLVVSLKDFHHFATIPPETLKRKLAPQSTSPSHSSVTFGLVLISVYKTLSQQPAQTQFSYMGGRPNLSHILLLRSQQWGRYQIILLGDRGTWVNNLPTDQGCYLAVHQVRPVTS